MYDASNGEIRISGMMFESRRVLTAVTAIIVWMQVMQVCACVCVCMYTEDYACMCVCVHVYIHV